MAEQFDNEDELARLKQWWSANGTAILIGAVLGLAVIGAWQGWQWYSDRQSQAAADTYAKVQQAIDSGQVNDAALRTAKKLENDYDGTPYAAAAALRLAAHYVEQQDYAQAAQQLDWAMNNAAEPGVRHIARVRKARLVWSQGDPKAALALLDADHPEAFDALYAELAGDIHADQGDREAAYKSYQLALENLPPDAPRKPLQDKRAEYAPAHENAGGPPTSAHESSEQPDAAQS